MNVLNLLGTPLGLLLSLHFPPWTLYEVFGRSRLALVFAMIIFPEAKVIYTPNDGSFHYLVPLAYSYLSTPMDCSRFIQSYSHLFTNDFREYSSFLFGALKEYSKGAVPVSSLICWSMAWLSSCWSQGSPPDYPSLVAKLSSPWLVAIRKQRNRVVPLFGVGACLLTLCFFTVYP